MVARAGAGGLKICSADKDCFTNYEALRNQALNLWQVEIRLDRASLECICHHFLPVETRLVLAIVCGNQITIEQAMRRKYAGNFRNPSQRRSKMHAVQDAVADNVIEETSRPR